MKLPLARKSAELLVVWHPEDALAGNAAQERQRSV
jgi:hypothetical protein